MIGTVGSQKPDGNNRTAAKLQVAEGRQCICGHLRAQKMRWKISMVRTYAPELALQPAFADYNATVDAAMRSLGESSSHSRAFDARSIGTGKMRQMPTQPAEQIA